jgi:hypothetical protein
MASATTRAAAPAHRPSLEIAKALASARAGRDTIRKRSTSIGFQYETASVSRSGSVSQEATRT